MPKLDLSNVEKLTHRMRQLARQQADVSSDPSFHKGQMLKAEDTIYWVAADTLEQQAAEVLRLSKEVEARDEAREAFLDMIADAQDWHDEPDGDETGDHTTYHLITHWREMERLCLALGIAAPRYMETWMDAIDRATLSEKQP